MPVHGGYSIGMTHSFPRLCVSSLVLLLLALPCAGDDAAAPVFIERFRGDWGDALQLQDEIPHEEVTNRLLPLGAMQKVRGVWAPRESERVSGELVGFSWRISDGFTVHEVLEGLETSLANADAELLFECDARACGSSSQWANRVFNERLLYGQEASQRYRCYRVALPAGEYRVMIYASARTASRQYLHVQSVRLF